MEKTIETIVTSGLSTESFFMLVTMMIVLFILLSLKDFVVRLVAWQSFKANLNISLGTWVRLSTSTGYVNGKIIRAGMTRIIVDTGVTTVYIPTKTFPNRDWVMLKNAPADCDGVDDDA